MKTGEVVIVLAAAGLIGLVVYLVLKPAADLSKAVADFKFPDIKLPGVPWSTGWGGSPDVAKTLQDNLDRAGATPADKARLVAGLEADVSRLSPLYAWLYGNQADTTGPTKETVVGLPPTQQEFQLAYQEAKATQSFTDMARARYQMQYYYGTRPTG